jgi:Heavy metal binding domain
MLLYSRSRIGVRSRQLLYGMTSVLVFAACATEPLPKVAGLDPSNPDAPESRPLVVSATKASPPEKAAEAATPSPRGPDVAADHAAHESAKDTPTASEPQPSAGAAVYACPMHPEVTSPKPGVCPKCGMRLVPKAAAPPKGKVHDHQHGAGGSP